ncbi:MAG: YitT family protein [Pigeon pea little leaf phytoplasma]|uniref:YitT family protein n=1 Tax=Candidatus Phytoplasma fabacearum TaxID=2982628 RepID=A0ABU8ZSH6_9MOLU|nr:YitT family protein ['Bituminaria bituminosa' little leaf phytoplasma]MDV3148773.1 YitT family protein [Pigeon pea little leaf phytoplasma]MDO7983554.1 YitT family protein ['Bituminaria bituminosa' little leaf phytoplasma]MDO8023958.1 YitT family protein ['Bituminaria bituminosa' little leaf phytoplasma]MDO8030678.1 YitT family protein ['Bituminaria bituminosa' little leaf phytoplasma]MDV3154062.1 YitT family protein [Pigeon pea little leaf phytoplasma]
MKRDRKFYHNNLHKWLILVFNDIILAITMFVFTLGSKLNVGGTDGLALTSSRLCNLFTNNPYFISDKIMIYFMFFYNILAIIIGYKIFGKKFILKSAILAIILMIVMFFLPYILGDSTIFLNRLLVWDNEYWRLCVASILGGLLVGFTQANIRQLGFTTGGMDVFQQVLKDCYGMNFKISLFITDGVLIFLSSILESFDQINFFDMFSEIMIRILLSLLSIYIMGWIMDKKVKFNLVENNKNLNY